MPSAIQRVLCANAISPEHAKSLYGPFHKLTNRLLGATPSFSAMAHCSPLTTVFYFGALRSCMHIPSVDFHNAALTPHHRRLAMLHSALVHGCDYCAGHCAAVGDVLSGPFPAQCQLDGVRDPFKHESEGDAQLKRLVREVCSVPSTASPAAKAHFVTAFSEKAYEELISVLAFSAWLNFVMYSCGMQLESEMVPFATQVLHQQEEEEEASTGETAPTEWQKSMRKLSAVANMALIGPSVVDATLREKAWFKGIPSRTDELDVWVEHLLGTLPIVVQRAQSPVAKRALALGFREALWEQSHTAWSRKERALFMFVFAQAIGNEELAEDAFFIFSSCVEVSDSAEETDEATGGANEMEGDTDGNKREQREGGFEKHLWLTAVANWSSGTSCSSPPLNDVPGELLVGATDHGTMEGFQKVEEKGAPAKSSSDEGDSEKTEAVSKKKDTVEGRKGDVDEEDREVAQNVWTFAQSDEEAKGRFAAALRFVFASASVQLTDKVEVDLVKWETDAGSIVDLAGMIGVFGFAHRLSVMSRL